MNYTAHMSSRQRAAYWASQELSPTALKVVLWLEGKLGLAYSEAWWGAQKIGECIGRSAGTVQSAIRELSLRGIVEIVADYTIKTRRRLVLLWRMPTEEPQTEPTPKTTEEPMSHDLPDDRRRVPVERPAAASPAVPASEPPRGGDEAWTSERPEVAAVLTDARPIPGATPEKVRAKAREVGLDVLGACVRWAAKRGKGWRWVAAVAPAWKSEGVPDYAADRSSGAVEETLEEKCMRLFGPGGEYEKPTFDMTPYAGIVLHDEY